MDLEVAWSMFFSSVVSLQYHPGSGRGDHVPLTIPECARISDLMLRELEARRDLLWRG